MPVVADRGRLGGTALVTVDGLGASTWHAPLGGTPALSDNGTRLSITEIALGTAATGKPAERNPLSC